MGTSDTEVGAGCFLAWFAIFALIGAGLLALFAWAVISLVTHFTA